MTLNAMKPTDLIEFAFPVNPQIIFGRHHTGETNTATDASSKNSELALYGCPVTNVQDTPAKVGFVDSLTTCASSNPVFPHRVS